MKRFLMVALPAIILIIGFVVMRHLLQSKPETVRRMPEPRERIVNAKIVRLRDVQTRIEAFGNLRTAQTITVSSEVSGQLLPGDVPFQAAQSFNRGDVFLQIDDRKVQMDLNTAKSDFLSAVAAVLPELKIDYPEEYKRWQEFFDGCCFTEEFRALPETDNQKVKLLLSRFNVFKLYFAVKNLELLLEKHIFIAPFNGSIVSTAVQIGSNARVGAVLGEIINLETMEVEVPVPAIDIKWINRREPVRLISSELSGEWNGRISRIGRNIDPNTQAVQVFIALDPTHGALPYNGIFLKAEIPTTTIKNALSIPRKNIYQERYVYLVNGGVLELREVTIDFKESDAAIVTDGLASGDTLIVDVLQGVAAGMRVRAVVLDEGEGENNE